jgi:quinohemoprotein ethanol dehydrogenase
VYLPVRDMGSVFKVDAEWEFVPGYWNTALDGAAFASYGGADAGGSVEAFLLAWDPVRRREAWRVPHVTAFNGGTLSTAGNLVFQGSADGRFVAYRATDGKVLWESPVGTGAMAGPVSYALDGEQYVAIAAGWGASFALSGGDAALAAGVRGGGRVLSFKLGGQAAVPPGLPPLGPVPVPSYEVEASDAERARAMVLFANHCSVCHGPMAVAGGSGVPDLRHSTAQTHAIFSEIVLEGRLIPAGMPKFDDVLEPDEVRGIQAWILEQARAASAAASPEAS